MKRSSLKYGVGRGDILLDNIMCAGGESTLLDCNHNPLMEVNCDHTEDAGVICGGSFDRKIISILMISYCVIFSDV